MNGSVPLQRSCLAISPGEYPEPIMLWYGDMVKPTGNKPDYQVGCSTPAPGLEVTVGEGEETKTFILLDNQSDRPLI